MSLGAVGVLGAHALLLLVLFLHDRWGSLSEFADGVEASLFPEWFQWAKWGDPVTWIHHTLVSVLFVAYGASWALLLPDSWLVGARAGAGVALCFYGVREGYGLARSFREKRKHPFWRGAPHHTGWLIDGIMDVVGAAALNWIVWRGWVLMGV